LLNVYANFLAFTVANIILRIQFGLQQNHLLKKLTIRRSNYGETSCYRRR